MMTSEEIEAQMRRLLSLRSRRRRKLSFDEACDFIAAISGQTVVAVKARLANIGMVDERCGQ
jgi:hypothetical protein